MANSALSHSSQRAEDADEASLDYSVTDSMDTRMSTSQAKRVSDTWQTNANQDVAAKSSGFWNSPVGRVLLGVCGLASYRACYNRARGHLAHRTGAMLVRYDTCKNIAEQTVARRQAKAAGVWELLGVGFSVLLGFLPNMIGAAAGYAKGKLDRAATRGPITMKDLTVPAQRHADKHLHSNAQWVEDYLCDAAFHLYGRGRDAKLIRQQSVEHQMREVTKRDKQGPIEHHSESVRTFKALHEFAMPNDGDDRQALEFTMALNLLCARHLSGHDGAGFAELWNDVVYISDRFCHDDGEAHSDDWVKQRNMIRNATDSGMLEFEFNLHDHKNELAKCRDQMNRWVQQKTDAFLASRQSVAAPNEQ